MQTNNIQLTGNPIKFDEDLNGKSVLLNSFAQDDNIPDSVLNRRVKLTGNKTWLYAGVGYAYQISVYGISKFWVKHQSINWKSLSE